MNGRRYCQLKIRVELTEMLDRRVSLLGCHTAFQATYLLNKLGSPWRRLWWPTLKPARCSLNAIRSKKDTNCELSGSARALGDGMRKGRKTHNTRDLIVQSRFLSFSNSSTRASSFELDLQFCLGQLISRVDDTRPR